MIYDTQLTESRPMNENDYNASKYNSSFLSQFKWLFWRQIKMDLRNPLSTKVVALQTIVFYL